MHSQNKWNDTMEAVAINKMTLLKHIIERDNDSLLIKHCCPDIRLKETILPLVKERHLIYHTGIVVSGITEADYVPTSISKHSPARFTWLYPVSALIEVGIPLEMIREFFKTGFGDPRRDDYVGIFEYTHRIFMAEMQKATAFDLMLRTLPAYITGGLCDRQAGMLITEIKKQMQARSERSEATEAGQTSQAIDKEFWFVQELNTQDNEDYLTDELHAYTNTDEHSFIEIDLDKFTEFTERLNLSKGVKADTGKPQYHLLPLDAVELVTNVLQAGAEKYSERNWEKGMDWSRPYNALMRHMFAWWQGNKDDKETNLPHLAHAACNALFLLAYTLRQKGCDDRPQQ